MGGGRLSPPPPKMSLGGGVSADRGAKLLQGAPTTDPSNHMDCKGTLPTYTYPALGKEGF